jgi:hypothetical protein
LERERENELRRQREMERLEREKQRAAAEEQRRDEQARLEDELRHKADSASHKSDACSVQTALAALTTITVIGSEPVSADAYSVETKERPEYINYQVSCMERVCAFRRDL